MSIFKKENKFLKQLLAAGLATTMLFTAACSNATPTEAKAETAPSQEASAQPSEEATSPEATETTPEATSEAEEKVYKIGITQIVSHPSLDNCRNGFLEGLKEGGYEEGKNLKVEFQDAQGDMGLAKSIVQKFISDEVSLVCAISTPVAQAAANELQNTGIPLVFNAVSEPVEAGLIDGFDVVTEGITGVSDKLPVEQQLALIREILPEAKTIGILYTTNEANSLAHIKQFEEAAPNYGFTIETMGVSTSSEIGTALDVLLGKVDCIQNLTDNMVVNALDQVLSKSDAVKIPVFGSEEEQVINGCIASEGIDYIGLGKQAGLQAAKLLDGAAIAEVPVEAFSQSRLTINAEVAEKLGVEIPESAKARAEIVAES